MVTIKKHHIWLSIAAQFLLTPLVMLAVLLTAAMINGTLDGNRITLSNIAASAIILHLWAILCAKLWAYLLEAALFIASGFLFFRALRPTPNLRYFIAAHGLLALFLYLPPLLFATHIIRYCGP